MFNNNEGLLKGGDTEPVVQGPDGENSYRHDYKMIDLFLIYRLSLLKKHKISLGFGPSYTWGKNEQSFNIFTLPHEKNASYAGVVPSVSYDFLFIRNRLNIGGDLRCRKYFGLPSEQIDYGLHLGVNF